MAKERMGNSFIEWDVEDFSIKVSIDGKPYFYPHKGFFESQVLPPKIKKAYKEICYHKPHNFFYVYSLHLISFQTKKG